MWLASIWVSFHLALKKLPGTSQNLAFGGDAKSFNYAFSLFEKTRLQFMCGRKTKDRPELNRSSDLASDS
jgi:hypothetical protein